MKINFYVSLKDIQVHKKNSWNYIYKKKIRHDYHGNKLNSPTNFMKQTYMSLDDIAYWKKKITCVLLFSKLAFLWILFRVKFFLVIYYFDNEILYKKYTSIYTFKIYKDWLHGFVFLLKSVLHILSWSPPKLIRCNNKFVNIYWPPKQHFWDRLESLPNNYLLKFSESPKDN